MPFKIMTVDLEPDLRSKETKSVELIVPKLLDYFKEQNIKATFFTVTSLLDKHEDIITEISKKHEIASHSHSHAWLNERNAEFEIVNSRLFLQNYGFSCHGFRAPKFITTKTHFELLKKAGYSYDSSFNTSSFSLKTIQDIPSIQFPAMYSGLTYRKLLHPLSTTFSSRMFYLHPWEFLKKEDLPKARSLTELLLRRNTGRKAWGIFTNFMEKESEQENTSWIGCKDWLEKLDRK